MKYLGISIFALGLVLSIGLYFSNNYKYEHYLIEDRTSEEIQYRVNLNLATWAEFDNLPGIGEVLAKEIIRDRDDRGRFNSVDDIKRVKGIGDKKFAAIRKYLTLEV